MLRLFPLLILILAQWPIISLAQEELDNPLVLVQETPSQIETVSSATDSDEIIVEVAPEDLTKSKTSGLYVASVQKLSQLIPQKLESLFKTFRVPTKIREFVVSDFKTKLEQAPPLIMKSNAQGGSLRLYGVVGMGISQLIVESLRNKKMGRYIPFKGRFGVVLGSGITILKINQNGKNKILIRFFADVERVDKIISWVFETFGGGSLSKVSTQVEEKVKIFEKAVLTRSNMGFAGHLTLSDNHFEHALSIGASLQPGISATYFYETQVNQYRINLFYNPEWVAGLKERIKKSCDGFFSKR